MDLDTLKNKATGFVKKYKYVAIILAIGLVFMIWPERKETEAHETEAVELQQSEPTVSEKLADILSKIEGAGDVQVLLTIAAGEETIFQTDDTVTVNDASSTTQIDTVIVSESDRGELGLIRQVNPPTYMGAIVVCQGADSPTVQLAIVDAVSKVTGLGANQISVLKMK